MRQILAQTLLALSVLVSLSPALHGEDPDYYVRQANWFDTLVASMNELDSRGLERGLVPFESDIMRGGDQAQQISVDVIAADSLHLFVRGDPNNIWGVANWANPTLIGLDGQSYPLTKAAAEGPGIPALDWSVRKGRHDININLHSGLYEPLRIAGRHFPLGIHVQADSEIELVLNGDYARFEAWIGIDDWAGTNGTARFQVLGQRAAATEQLWDLLERDFPHAQPRREIRWERQDRIWNAAWHKLDLPAIARRYAATCDPVLPLAGQASALAHKVTDKDDLALVRAIYLRARAIRDAISQVRTFDREALRLAISDLRRTYGEAYPNGGDYLVRLRQLTSRGDVALRRIKLPEPGLEGFLEVKRVSEELAALRQQALLENPLLRFDKLLVVKRRPIGDPRRSQWADRGLGEYLGMPRQSSWGHGTMPNTDRWENQIATLSPVHPAGELTTLFRPDGNRLVTDIDLHWDGQRMLLAMPDRARQWQVWELTSDGHPPRQLTPTGFPDVHNYDPCYLPNDRVVFMSTATLQGVPCNAGVIVGMMYLMEGDGSNIRQICFEQDHDYTPSVLNDGRVLYLRWDYTDTPHVWNRLLMSMNPDGTGQREFYGSNSYWPNSMFFARAIPGHRTRVAAIVTGHHEGRVGQLVLLDPAKGRHEADGVIQRIPGRGRPVEPVIEDKPTEHSWPKFLHPWPLSDKYFLVAAKPRPEALWGIYLADVFDNLVLIHEEEEFALLEPIPYRPRSRPPVIQDQVRPAESEAIVYLQNIYRGPGLEGVPRGTVKQLRLFTYHFGFQRMAGIDHRVGSDGPWEVKRVLGTVPVRPDGSALFRIPAKTPLSLQPLDAEGKAVALMRSWMTAQPGEFVSCVGCHESQNTAPVPDNALALAREPSRIRPWYGPPRGFSFAREVQPVLDQYCVSCHNAEEHSRHPQIPDLRARQGKFVVYERGNLAVRTVQADSKADLVGQYAGVFDPSYVTLREYVRVGGLESDLHPLPPKEFHADTSELIQMLKKGHHNVKMDAEAWDRLITWIDLNAPCHGSWAEVSRIPLPSQRERRIELRRLYGGVLEDHEALPDVVPRNNKPVIPEPEGAEKGEAPYCEDWPFDNTEAARRQAALGEASRVVDLGGGVSIEFIRIPAGRFVMGNAHGAPDESPLRVVEVSKPFWMSICEISNEQYGQFDPSHDSRFEHRSSWIFDETYLGWPLNEPRQPVVRVSWEETRHFCRWLSEKAGLHIDLPTEIQWEYACRAGTDTPLFYGDFDTDFSAYANMADASIRRLAEEGWRPKAPDLIPRDNRFNDGALVTAQVGLYAPNAWGLVNMHGNAAEWTRSPYHAKSVRGNKIVRGGSWRDRPKRCHSAFRLAYPAYQKVFNVGFRIVIEEEESLWAKHHPLRSSSANR